MKGKSSQETTEKLNKHYGESAPSIRMFYKFIKVFRSSHISISDAERYGRPVETITPEIIHVHDIVMDDRRVKLRDIASVVGILNQRIYKIFHQHLDMRKLSPRWVPRLLTVDQKRNRVRYSKNGLQQFQRDPQGFRHPFVTVDETWIHHCTLEFKGQFKQRVDNGESFRICME